MNQGDSPEVVRSSDQLGLDENFAEWARSEIDRLKAEAAHRDKRWQGRGKPLTNTRIFNHFHRTYPNTHGAKQMFSAGVRWAEEQHDIRKMPVREDDDA